MDDTGNPEAKLLDRDGHLIDGVIVLAQVARVLDQPADRPDFDFF